MGFYMSETIITSDTHAFFWRAHMCDRHGRGKEQESFGGGFHLQATPPGGALSPLQGPRVGHGSQQAAINEGHHPQSQTHRPLPDLSNWRTKGAASSSSLSFASCVTCGIDEFGSRVRYSLKVYVHSPTAPSRKSFHQGGVRSGGDILFMISSTIMDFAYPSIQPQRTPKRGSFFAPLSPAHSHLDDPLQL